VRDRFVSKKLFSTTLEGEEFNVKLISQNYFLNTTIIIFTTLLARTKMIPMDKNNLLTVSIQFSLLWIIPFQSEAQRVKDTDKPDFTPYKARPNLIPLDQMNPKLSALKGKQLYWARKSMKQPLDEADEIDDDVLNKIVWYAMKGYDIPYPIIRKE
jgi:hypothetical protein